MSLVQEFATSTYEVERMTSSGQYVDGFWVPGTTQRIQVTGSLQPMSMRDLELLPEGERVKQTFKIYTDTVLFTGREGGLRSPDRVCIGGEWFRVQASERWDGTDLPYFKSLLVRENPEEERRTNVG